MQQQLSSQPNPPGQQDPFSTFISSTFSEPEREILLRSVRIAAAKKYAARGDILRWGFCLFPDKFKLPFCKEMHEYFVEIRGEEKTNTEAPRNHSKTTIKCFLIPIFQALHEPRVFEHYLNVQATGPKALSVNTGIKKEFEENEILRAIYGDVVNPDRWTDQQFVLTNGVIFTCVSAGQSIRGLNYRNKRPDYIIIDDLYDEEDINNVESTEKKNDWFWGTLYPCRAKTKRTSIHVQGTAINGEDLLEKLKANADWHSKTFKALNYDNRKVLWPELNTFDELESDRVSMGSVIFFRELQNERRDETSAIVKRSWLKDWERDPHEFLKFDLHWKCMGIELNVDPSIGEKSENDYTGMALIYRCQYDDGRAAFFFIDQIWNEHWSLDKRVLAIQEAADNQPKTYPISRANIEEIAGFRDFGAEVIRRTTVPVNEIKVVKDKISNLESKSHFFENKRVFINENIEPKLKDILVYQLTTNHPKHDDVRDAVLLGLNDDGGLWNFVVDL